MLVAIFILLLIVFFPLLSLYLGVGFMVVLVKFWWVIAAVFLIFVLLKIKRVTQNNSYKNQNSISISKKYKWLSPASRELSNDAFKLYLIEEFNITKHELLEEFVVQNKIYPTLNAALNAAKELYEVRLKNEANISSQALLKARARQRKNLLLIPLWLAIFVLCANWVFPVIFEMLPISVINTLKDMGN